MYNYFHPINLFGILFVSYVVATGNEPPGGYYNGKVKNKKLKY